MKPDPDERFVAKLLVRRRPEGNANAIVGEIRDSSWLIRTALAQLSANELGDF